MNKKILFATDLDGTLLDKTCKIPSASAARLREMTKQGLLFTVATGRHPRSAAVALEGSGLSFSAPAVCLNGAVLWDMERDFPVDAWTIDPGAMKAAWEVVANEPVPLHVYACDLEKKLLTRYYLPWIDPIGVSRSLVYEPTSEPPCVFAPIGHEPDPLTVCASYFDKKEKLAPINRRLRQISGIRTVFYASTRFPDMYYLEFYASAGGKGVAARRAMEFCGAEALYVFGDSENDVDMFALADRSFAPKNASSIALEKADEIIPANTDGGVVLTVERFFR